MRLRAFTEWGERQCREIPMVDAAAVENTGAGCVDDAPWRSRCGLRDDPVAELNEMRCCGDLMTTHVAIHHVRVRLQIFRELTGPCCIGWKRTPVRLVHRVAA